MAYSLLPYSEYTPLKIEYFPTLFQCFIYRNHKMITAERTARVLAASVEEILRHAEMLGLDGFATEQEEAKWLKRGYITLIRANWHILTYAQLCTLLDFSEDYLAFILQEDDFLGIKLGRQKPQCDTLKIRELTSEELRRTDAIAVVTRELQKTLGKASKNPFDFACLYPTEKAEKLAPSRFSASFCYSYCALYGDTFLDDSLIEASFSDELLRAYAALGIGGIWTQAVLYSLVPCRYDPALSVGWEKRIEGLRKVIDRLACYGLKLYLYINEPRELGDSVFEKHPHLRGDVMNKGYASLCLSVPEVQDFLRDAIRTLTENAPGLGGYITITASENHTNCYSHRESGETTCPRCKSKKRGDLYALVNRLIYEGATAVNPDIEVIAYNWAWDREAHSESKIEVDGDRRILEAIPKDIVFLGVSERGKEKTLGTTTVEAADYSISITGPSEYAMNRFAIARELGARIGAKVQLNNSWELSTVPYIPVFGHFYRSIRDLCEKVNPDVLMMTWTHGGFPSPVFRMLSKMTEKGTEFPELSELLLELFPNAEPKKLLDAIAQMDEAFDEYPFSVHTMYFGPQHMGPALPLWSETTGYNACMVGQPYDKLADWCRPYPAEVYRDAFYRLKEGFARGYDMLLSAYEEKELTSDDRLLLDCTEGAYLHFASSYNHIRYIMEKDNSNDLTVLIRDEEELAIREARLVGRNPAIGYEASNHYFFTESDLYEKVLNCRYLLGEL